MKQVECTVPVLGVESLQRSSEFYTKTLDFKLDWGDESGQVCSVSRDGCSIMLAKFAKPGTWVWIGLEDDSLFSLYAERGVKVRQEPKNFPWAYEMKIEDIDGNVLWLGTGPRSDEPFDNP